jgi:hypothetical protein
MVVSETINNDELAAFVTSTLNAIASGVGAATSDSHEFDIPDQIEFEVAVKATKNSEVGGGLRIQVFSAESKKGSQDEAISKITFAVSTSSKRNRGPMPKRDTSWMA